jgi:acyl-CoA hydrolase
MTESWRDLYDSRLASAEDAVGRIRPGATVNIPILAPRVLMDALWSRREALRDVRLQLCAASYDPSWLQPGSEDAFSIDFELFIGDFARSAHDEKRGYYLPNLFSTTSCSPRSIPP